jgi:hypothetical protein
MRARLFARRQVRPWPDAGARPDPWWMRFRANASDSALIQPALVAQIDHFLDENHFLLRIQACE